MVRLVINSIAELKIFQAKIKALKNTLPQIQKQAMVKTANEDVLDEIKKEMAANDFSDKIIDATFVGRIEKFGSIIRTHFISNFVSDSGFDVSNAREEGTRQPNPITSNNPDGALKIPLGTGGFIFRKISRPEGMPRLLIIERTLKRVQNDSLNGFKENVGNAVAKFLGV